MRRRSRSRRSLGARTYTHRKRHYLLLQDTARLAPARDAVRATKTDNRYIYDLALPSNDIQLAPSDGEAESFELMDKDTILQRMFAGEFKPNCTLGRSTHSLTHSPPRLFHSARMAYTRERKGLLCHSSPASHTTACSHAIIMQQ